MASAESLWTAINAWPGQLLMRKPQAVREKISRMVSDGPSKLHILTDFDYTMSKFSDSEGQCWTTHRVMEAEAAIVSPTLGKELEALKEKYMAIEFDPKLSKEEKTPHMVTWWETAHDKLVTAGFSRTDLEDGVRRSRILLRDGCADVMKMVEKAGIPFVVFSAGIGDIIDLVLSHQFPESCPEYHLVSNRMDYDSGGKVSGFRPPLVHTFNKNESVVGEAEGLAERLEGRPNVLLLGDSLGDIHMDVGAKGEALCLKIGFLNFKFEELRPKYEEVYDIVLVSDSTWDFPQALLKAVVQA